MKYIFALFIIAGSCYAGNTVYMSGYYDGAGLVVRFNVSADPNPPVVEPNLTGFSVPLSSVDPTVTTLPAACPIALWTYNAGTLKARSKAAVDADFATWQGKRDAVKKGAIQAKITALQTLRDAAPGDANIQAALTEAQGQIAP